MRGTLAVALGLVSGCGFHTGGQGSPSEDAAGKDAAHDGSMLSDAGIDTMADAAGLRCPSSYGAILGYPTQSRYRFETTATTWLQAEQDCEDDGAAISSASASHLIVIDDVAERVAMIGGLAGSGNLNDQWVGATDLAAEGTVGYVTAQATTLALTPSMQADNKDCIRMKNSGNTEYRDCDEQNRYVCECDGVVADAARYPNLPDGNGN